MICVLSVKILIETDFTILIFISFCEESCHFCFTHSILANNSHFLSINKTIFIYIKHVEYFFVFILSNPTKIKEHQNKLTSFISFLMLNIYLLTKDLLLVIYFYSQIVHLLYLPTKIT